MADDNVIRLAEMNEQVEHYSSLPYTIIVEPQDDGRGIYYVARVVELRDLLMTGDTMEEAVKELEAVKREWIEEYLKLGNKMPRPLKSRNYSGKVIVRMPPSLHQVLTEMAQSEGVSFNQYMVTALARTAGRDEARKHRVTSGKPARSKSPLRP